MRAKTPISELFYPAPEQWGLRGDPFLWREMARAFRGVPAPDLPQPLARSLTCMFEALTSHSIDSEEPVHVARYESGGMSSGQVSPEFWRQVGLPLLLRRSHSEAKAGAGGQIGGVQDCRDLLKQFVSVLSDLRVRGVLRTGNNPVADYTEWLVCERLGLTMAASSTTGFDAADQNDVRFEIKARRMVRHSRSVQLSAIRNLAAKHFDYLVGVVYNADFSIRYAVKIPHALVQPHARFSKHTNSHLVRLNEDLLTVPGIQDITALLTA